MVGSALDKALYGEIGKNCSDSQYILEEKLMWFAGGLGIFLPHSFKLSHSIPQYEYSILHLAIPWI